MKKIKVTEYLESMSVYDLDGSIKDTIDTMSRIIAKYPNYSALRINVQNLDDTVGLEIEGDRFETDLEFQKRVCALKKLKLAKKAKHEQKQEQEFKLYLSLKKKYEKS